MSWAVNVSGEPVPLVAYPYRQTKQGVSVEINRCKRTLAAMKSDHVGIFEREGKTRLSIKELRGSRPVDALLHQGVAQGVADRGATPFAAPFVRVLSTEEIQNRRKTALAAHHARNLRRSDPYNAASRPRGRGGGRDARCRWSGDGEPYVVSRARWLRR